MHFHFDSKFEFVAKDVHANGFTIITRRTDAQSGWGQDVKVEWSALDGEYLGLVR